MPYFRKRPVVVEARRFSGRPDGDLEVWMGDAFESWIPSKRQVAIRTREGEMIGSAGDWIIMGVAGEFYACKPDVFEATYDQVAEEFGSAYVAARRLDMQDAQNHDR